MRYVLRQGEEQEEGKGKGEGGGRTGADEDLDRGVPAARVEGRAVSLVRLNWPYVRLRATKATRASERVSEERDGADVPRESPSRKVRHPSHVAIHNLISCILDLRKRVKGGGEADAPLRVDRKQVRQRALSLEASRSFLRLFLFVVVSLVSVVRVVRIRGRRGGSGRGRDVFPPEGLVKDQGVELDSNTGGEHRIRDCFPHVLADISTRPGKERGREGAHQTTTVH